jgi:hypothetical protein
MHNLPAVRANVPLHLRQLDDFHQPLDVLAY